MLRIDFLNQSFAAITALAAASTLSVLATPARALDVLSVRDCVSHGFESGFILAMNDLCRYVDMTGKTHKPWKLTHEQVRADQCHGLSKAHQPSQDFQSFVMNGYVAGKNFVYRTSSLRLSEEDFGFMYGACNAPRERASCVIQAYQSGYNAAHRTHCSDSGVPLVTRDARKQTAVPSIEQLSSDPSCSSLQQEYYELGYKDGKRLAADLVCDDMGMFKTHEPVVIGD
jgi:hypothetical protein